MVCVDVSEDEEEDDDGAAPPMNRKGPTQQKVAITLSFESAERCSEHFTFNVESFRQSQKRSEESVRSADVKTGTRRGGEDDED